MPAGACDCRNACLRSALSRCAGARLFPPDASATDYRSLQRKRIGTGAASAGHAIHLRCGQPLHAAGTHCVGWTRPGACRDRRPRERHWLQTLHDAGVRGVQLNLSLGVTGLVSGYHPFPCPAHLRPGAGTYELPVKPTCWPAGVLRGVPVLVFDHLGRVARQAGGSILLRTVAAAAGQGRAGSNSRAIYIVEHHPYGE